MWTPGVGILIGLPFAVAAFTMTDTTWVLVCLFVPTLTTSVYPGPSYATVQRMVGARMRAVAMAFTLFIVSVVGLGIGPVLVGAISDALQPAFGQESLRMSLLSIQGLKLWSALHYVLAAGSLVRDLECAPD